MAHRALGIDADLGVMLPCNVIVYVDAKGKTNMMAMDPATGLVWTINGNLAGTELAWQEALEFIAELNREGFAGASNWRLPSRDELESLYTLIRMSDFAEGPESVQDGFYWSANVPPLEPDYALAVNLEDGSVDEQNKGDFNFVWPVR